MLELPSPNSDLMLLTDASDTAIGAAFQIYAFSQKEKDSPLRQLDKFVYYRNR